MFDDENQEDTKKKKKNKTSISLLEVTDSCL